MTTLQVLDDAISSLKKIKESATSIRNINKLGLMFRECIVNDNDIYLTGIGKPGYVAQKCAATLKSIMVNAQFIDATLAGHGDLGSVSTKRPSLLIALSKSGCSSELYTLFKVIKQLRPKCKVVIVCMSNDMQIKQVKSCKDIDYICRIECDPGELDGYGIVPATSNMMFECILDMAISSAFECDNLGMVDMCKRLQMSHPSGTLYNKVTNLLEKIENEDN